jgi:Fic family protein
MEDIKKIVEEYQSLNLHDVIDYDKFNQYAIVHHSSSIEGSTLTENETRLLLEEGVTPKGKPLEHCP